MLTGRVRKCWIRQIGCSELSMVKVLEGSDDVTSC